MHDSNLNFDVYGEFHKHTMILVPIILRTLLRYIEERSKGKTKDTILNELTDYDLGKRT